MPPAPDPLGAHLSPAVASADVRVPGAHARRRRARGHRVSDIAEQAGLSAATVDRVLHDRPGVSARAVHQVEQALLDLDRQQTQLRLGSRTLLLDVVMAAPERFTAAVREALEHELPALRPATVRARFRLGEQAGPTAVDGLVATLDAVGRRGRGSQGVLLKAPDDARVAAAVRRLADRGIPVVTLVTDVRESGRIAYAGLDNTAAGATAAYLLSQWLGTSPGAPTPNSPEAPIDELPSDAGGSVGEVAGGSSSGSTPGASSGSPRGTASASTPGGSAPSPTPGGSAPSPTPGSLSGAVLVTLSRSTFFGEQERRTAFEAALARLDPRREVVVLADADGLDEGTAGLVRGLLSTRRDVAAVYSVGGGNRAIAAELARAGVRPRVFLGHDLDADNLDLLRDGTLTAVLHHDLRADMRRACQQVLRHHHLLPGAPTSHHAAVQIITPHNVPPRLGVHNSPIGEL